MSAPLARLSRPEYTGENRCLPCTLVNALLALALAAAVGALLAPAVGLAVFLAALAVVWLRGYLVPGTPELTKRYLPARVLAAFDADHEAESVELPIDEDGLVDPEAALRTAGAVEDGADGDLVLTDSFEAEWDEACRDIRADRPAQGAALAGLLDADEVTVHEELHGPGAYVDAERVHHWPSEGAMLADAGAAVVLADRPGWADVQVAQRLGLLRALRSFLSTCPVCDAPVAMTEGEVESCCQYWDVIAVRCSDCGTHFLEVDPGTGDVTSEPETVGTEDRGPQEVAGGFTR